MLFLSSPPARLDPIRQIRLHGILIFEIIGDGRIYFGQRETGMASRSFFGRTAIVHVFHQDRLDSDPRPTNANVARRKKIEMFAGVHLFWLVAEVISRRSELNQIILRKECCKQIDRAVCSISTPYLFRIRSATVTDADLLV
jgi:hypothetical protein